MSEVLSEELRGIKHPIMGHRRARSHGETRVQLTCELSTVRACKQSVVVRPEHVTRDLRRSDLIDVRFAVARKTPQGRLGQLYRVGDHRLDEGRCRWQSGHFQYAQRVV